LECMEWDQQEPHKHKTDPETFPYSGLVGSYCRNPDNKPDGVWCYTMDPEIEWTYCGVPTCPGKQVACTANSARVNGSDECECNSGYEDSEDLCVNINECLDADICGVNEDCIDTEGSYKCTCTAHSARANSTSECECSTGYKEWEGKCVNVNECVDDDICGKNEECFDTEGSYKCVCNRCKTRGEAGGCSVHVYHIYTEALLWADAQLYCEEKELMLAKVNSKEDNDALYDAISAEFGRFNITPGRWDQSNWLWIGATDEVTQGVYLFTDGDELTYNPPWAKGQGPVGDNWVRSRISGTEDHLSVSRWGEWDDSFGKLYHRSFACTC